MIYEIKENLKKLSAICGVCGYEKELVDQLSYLTSGGHYSQSRNPLGNLILRRSAEGARRVMISAPIDAPGFIVTFIDGAGMLHLSALGSPALQYLPNRRVISQSGVRGIIVASKEDKITSDEELTIDIGAQSRAEAEKAAAIGDVFGLLPDGEALGENLFVGPAVGARACAAALLDISSRIDEANCELYIVFTTQSRVSHRGAKTAASAIKPDISISLAPLCYNGKNYGGQDKVATGSGVIALCRDGQVVSDAELYGKLIAIGGEKISERVSKDISTSASIIDAQALGCASLALGIPITSPATPAERVDVRDAALAADIITELVLSL